MIDQIAQSLRLSRSSLPPFEIERNSLPLSMPAAIIQASIAFLTHTGIATVRRTLYTLLRLICPHQRACGRRPVLSTIGGGLNASWGAKSWNVTRW